MASFSPPNRPRLLCLHGFATCGAILKRQLGRVAKRLDEAGLDLHFPDAEAQAEATAEGSAPGMIKSIQTFYRGLPNLQWMRAVTLHADGTVTPQDLDAKAGKGIDLPDGAKEQYAGIEEAIALAVREIARAEAEGRPFEGILGFSQGANLAAMLVLLAESGFLPAWRIKCIVCIGGAEFGWREQFADPAFAARVAACVPGCPVAAEAVGEAPPLERATLSTPALHLIGKDDGRVQKAERLAEWFENRTYALFPGAHHPPRKSEDQSQIFDFLDKHLELGSVMMGTRPRGLPPVTCAAVVSTANTLGTITAIRDSSWRDSTHHVSLNLGDCYVDVVMGKEGSAKFDTLSFGGYGACSTFKGIEMPRELSDLLFGAMPAKPKRAEIVLQQGGEETARVRAMLSAALRPHAVGNVSLLATLEQQNLTYPTDTTR